MFSCSGVPIGTVCYAAATEPKLVVGDRPSVGGRIQFERAPLSFRAMYRPSGLTRWSFATRSLTLSGSSFRRSANLWRDNSGGGTPER